MPDSPLFGEYLDSLLTARGLKSQDLRDVYDPSGIRRWLRHERVPRWDRHGPKLVTSLELSQQEEEALREAHKTSIQLSTDDRIGLAAERRLAVNNVVPLGEKLTYASQARMIEAIRSGAADAGKTTPLLLPGPRSPGPTSYRVPRQPVEGRENVIKEVIKLLHQIGKAPTSGEAIKVTFQGNRSLFDDYPDLGTEYAAALRSALDQAWNVDHIWRLDALGSERSVDRVTQMLRFLGAKGRYQPYYIETYGALSPTYDILDVPSVGSMLGLSTTDSDCVTTAMFFGENSREREALRSHYSLLLDKSAKILTTYPRRSAEFSHAVLEIENIDADRCLIIDGLSDGTVPDTLTNSRIEELLDRYSGDPFLGNVLESIRKHRLARRASFTRQLSNGTHHFRDVCPESALARYIETGWHTSDDWLQALPGRKASRPEQREHLKEVLDLLKNPRYHLALVDEIGPA